MTDMPKEIWAADLYMTANNGVLIGMYVNKVPTGKSTQYIRADVADELVEALEHEAKYLKRVAAIITGRNGAGSVLDEELSKPLTIRALKLEKTIAAYKEKIDDR